MKIQRDCSSFTKTLIRTKVLKKNNHLMFQMLDILQRIGIGLGKAGAKSAVDLLCNEQDQEVLHLKKKVEVFLFHAY